MEQIEHIIIRPRECREIIRPAEYRRIERPAESRTIIREKHQMQMTGSKTHTVGATARWIVDYCKWLANTAQLTAVQATSSSLTLTVSNVTYEGSMVIFFLKGGALGETATLTLTITDTFGNIQPDTLSFTVVAP
jgi:hypothetical protein